MLHFTNFHSVPLAARCQIALSPTSERKHLFTRGVPQREIEQGIAHRRWPSSAVGCVARFPSPCQIISMIVFLQPLENHSLISISKPIWILLLIYTIQKSSKQRRLRSSTYGRSLTVKTASVGFEPTTLRSNRRQQWGGGRNTSRFPPFQMYF